MKHNKEFGAGCTKVASASCLEVSKHLHELKVVSLDEVIECRVTVDGIWSKRGCTAMFGVLVISWESGQAWTTRSYPNTIWLVLDGRKRTRSHRTT